MGCIHGNCKPLLSLISSVSHLATVAKQVTNSSLDADGRAGSSGRCLGSKASSSFEVVPSQGNKSSLAGLVLFPVEQMVTPVSLAAPVTCFLSWYMKPSTTGALTRAKQMVVATILSSLQDSEQVSLLGVKGPSFRYFIIAPESNRML